MLLTPLLDLNAFGETTPPLSSTFLTQIILTLHTASFRLIFGLLHPCSTYSYPLPDLYLDVLRPGHKLNNIRIPFTLIHKWAYFLYGVLCNGTRLNM